MAGGVEVGRVLEGGAGGVSIGGRRKMARRTRHDTEDQGPVLSQN